ncbi:DNA topoisomerase IV subunit A [Sphingomonas sp. 10B4]|uniref:DNA topoisomerase IV subunit A n=1 Tax=Sphingomonas sp. 10B4 TaxID=3048575 RepID=UPI002AB4E305|nr:DNA topoisomerase IV subunit A [Sphingomonas sp. 10B4]MDY7523123.1 DNA topoisomerase IV subunit A [Sphingomonas sp. 10B4]MEB0284331.1 DNA topoisomerase IV subunit A [Sphingomonas sp. 10B4]
MPTDVTDPFNAIVDAPFDSALSDRYLVYALSTITARSLPDVRDGMKPVHRRLLWAMRQLRMDPSTPYKKSARVVGEVIGKYHPHGDSSVYDAMVRLAQDFSVRYPLVEGQGNFGNIDGDGAAAFRYTEARLTQVAMDLMAGLDEDAVNYKPTYNNEEQEPELFPGAFPNLLANGAAGIAVGMATNIPPHNVAELYDAAIMLIDQPEADDAAMLQHIQGPDFPTGGLVVDSPAAIAEAYATGRGGFRLRARWSIEKEKGGGWNAIITEIPYGVQKGKLIEQIAALINDKKLPILADVRDESDSEIRVVIEPRSRSVEPDMLMESLFKMTDLEVRFSMNLNLLDADRTPRVMSLRQALLAWITHQFIVLQRRTAHRLDKIRDRIELLDGYIIAYLNLDRVIEIIRTEDEPKPVMMAEFELNDRQVEAILNMRLRSLRRLEEMELRKERDGLENERSGLEALLGSEARQRTRLKKDFGKLRERYGPETKLGRRRTTVAEAAPARDIPLEAMIEREPITVILSQRGWIRAMKGHLDAAGVAAVKFKDGDAAAFDFTAQTTDKIMIAAENGRFYTLAADRLPGGRGFGEPVRLMIDLDGDVDIVEIFRASLAEKLLVAATDGRGFLVRTADIIAETRKGKTVVTPRLGAKLKLVRPVDPAHDYVAAIGDNRRLLVFPLSELAELSRGQGVQLMRFRDGGLSDAITFVFAEGLSWPMGGDTGRTRTETDLAPWRAARGAAGRMPPNGFPRDNRF